MKRLTLCIVHDGRRVLLGFKKRGFGAGRWNGFGGKVHPGENIEQATIRETKEEAGITVKKLLKRGILTFHFEEDSPILSARDVLEVHLFSANEFTGEPGETEEMIPRWFAYGEIPYDAMWAGDRYWLPLILEGKNIRGEFFFKDTETLVSHSIMTL